MNRKPKSWAALQRAVMLVDFKSMPSKKRAAKMVDRAILIYLANNGSDLGAGARPGNANLMQAAGVEWSQVHAHLGLLEKAEMIEWDRVRGRGLASTFRINWRHPVFPDHSPNMREWFVIGPEVAPEEMSGLAENKCPVFDENVRFEEQKCPDTNGKISGFEAENGRKCPDSLAGAQPTLPTKNHPTLPRLTPGGWQAFLQSCGPRMEKAPLTKKYRAWLEKLVSKYEPEIVAAAVREWESRRDFTALRESRWITFQREGDPWMREAYQKSPAYQAHWLEQRRHDFMEKIAAMKLDPARENYLKNFATKADEAILHCDTKIMLEMWLQGFRYADTSSDDTESALIESVTEEPKPKPQDFTPEMSIEEMEKAFGTKPAKPRGDGLIDAVLRKK